MFGRYRNTRASEIASRSEEGSGREQKMVVYFPIRIIPMPQCLTQINQIGCPPHLELGDNGALLPNLVRQVQTAGVIPFVGAGLSAPYNLPQWSELIHGLAPDVETRSKVEELLKAGEYEGAAQHLMEVKGPRLFQLAFRARFDNAVIDFAKETAIRSLARLPHGPIVTTNFDQVLETVLRHEGCEIDVVAGNQPAKVSDAFQYSTDALLKVHGDIEDPAGRVLAATEYEEAYSQWLAVLLRNVATNCLLFLGCSLRTDRPMKVLAELVREGHGLTNHYAFLAVPATAKEIRERSKQLAEDYHILAIWYPADEHDYVRKILDYVTDQLSPELRRNYQRPLFRDIPEGRAKLFGRNSDELMKLVESSQIVAIEGRRGVGKTSFALHALRRFMQHKSFGALAWITASMRKEALRLSQVFDSVSLAIDFPFKPQATVVEKESLLARELARRKIRCLLLLDNYETVADPDIEAFLFNPGRLPPNLSVLITVTGRLDHNGVVPYPLEELSANEAADMFRDRLARDQLEQESDADVGKLYATVGGNPLAIEWVVGQMRSGAQLPRLLGLLQKGAADVLPRVFEQSWRRLDSPQRTLLAAFSIFVRPALEQALLAASSLGEKKFHESLESLMKLYLVKRLRLHAAEASQLTGARYFVHPFTRDFLEGQQTPDLAAKLYARVAAFYAAYIPARGGTPEKEEAADLRELNGERENIVGVLEGCWKSGRGKDTVPVVQAMARWLFTESHWDDLEHCGSYAVKEAEGAEDPHAAARILSEMGRIYTYRADFERADKTLP